MVEAERQQKGRVRRRLLPAVVQGQRQPQAVIREQRPAVVLEQRRTPAVVPWESRCQPRQSEPPPRASREAPGRG
jgi:hypothetical protein